MLSYQWLQATVTRLHFNVLIGLITKVTLLIQMKNVTAKSKM